MRTYVKDADLIQNRKLPASDETVRSEAIELKGNADEDFLKNEMQLLISAPAIEVANLADDEEMIYAVEQSDDKATWTGLAVSQKQIGADGAGADAVEFVIAIPSNVQRYVRLVVTASANHDTSALNAELALVV